jgi:hypothetical protein
MTRTYASSSSSMIAMAMVMLAVCVTGPALVHGASAPFQGERSATGTSQLIDPLMQPAQPLEDDRQLQSTPSELSVYRGLPHNSAGDAPTGHIIRIFHAAETNHSALRWRARRRLLVVTLQCANSSVFSRKLVG